MAANSNGKASEDKRPELKGVDIVYLKNVVLKFVEATVRNDIMQRDALLPAIATLVQATPQVRSMLRLLHFPLNTKGRGAFLASRFCVASLRCICRPPFRNPLARASLVVPHCGLECTDPPSPHTSRYLPPATFTLQSGPLGLEFVHIDRHSTPPRRLCNPGIQGPADCRHRRGG